MNAPTCQNQTLTVAFMHHKMLGVCEDCFRAHVERTEQEEEAERRSKMLAAASLSRKMRDWSLATYPRDKTGRAALDFATRWLYEYRRGGRCNLIVRGGVGVGKTGLAWGIVRALIEDDGTPALLLNWRDMLDSLRAAISEDRESSLSKRARTVPVLVLDDLGAERQTDFAREELALLVEARYQAELPTIVTTNYQLEEMVARISAGDTVIGKRIVSRLEDGAMVMKLVGDDRRSQGGD